MKINYIYSSKFEGVTLDADVEIYIDDVDKHTPECEKILLLFWNHDVYTPDRLKQEIQNRLTDLPEIQAYIEWADNQIEASRDAYIDEHQVADDDDLYGVIGEWWEFFSAAFNFHNWPTWDKYLKSIGA